MDNSVNKDISVPNYLSNAKTVKLFWTDNRDTEIPFNLWRTLGIYWLNLNEFNNIELIIIHYFHFILNTNVQIEEVVLIVIMSIIHFQSTK